MATKGVGLHNYIVRVGGPDHPNAKLKFAQGDVITSMIETTKGETIIVTHDCNSTLPLVLEYKAAKALGSGWQ